MIVDKLKKLISNEVVDFCLLEDRLFELQSYFDGYRKLVIIDALPPGAKPGKVKILWINEPIFKICNAYSLHDLDLLWQIQYGFLNGFTGELMLIGIEARSIEYGEGLTLDLTKILSGVVSRVEQDVLLFLKD